MVSSPMTVSVSSARVKEKCGVSGTTYDAVINNLIGETVPAVRLLISEETLASDDTDLAALVNLAATEWVAGEFMAQRLREPGVAEGITVGELTLRPPARNLVDPSGLKAQGFARLLPYLRFPAVAGAAFGVLAGGDSE